MGSGIRFGKRVRRALWIAGCTTTLAMGHAQAASELTEISLEDLMNVTVTSASKREQSKMDVAAAISVVTNEDIRRSGATNIPEALRMVPGLNVARIDAHRWAITVRGYNGAFANKLLVLIDGRQVYTPLFGGVYWDIQSVPLSDIDRIEVIRGSGGTLWGANAVNGVINIITKRAEDTQGLHAMGLAGNQEYQGEARFGGKAGEDTAYRVWGQGQQTKDFWQPPPPGAQLPRAANDGYWTYQVGARVDHAFDENDGLTVSGQFYQGQEREVDTAGFPVDDGEMIGGHILTRWTHAHSDTVSTEVQAYYDRTDRDSEVEEDRNAFDLQFQNDFQVELGVPWLVNWGAEYFWTGDDTVGDTGARLDPPDDTFNRVSGFAQIQWNFLDADLQLIGGTKLEWNSYTDFEYQPSGRVLWKFLDGNSLWAAGSRAVRNPTRVDRDVIATIGGMTLNLGNKDIQAESVSSAELGYRNLMLENVSVDLVGFYNKYKDLVGVSTNTFAFANNLESQSWGTEIEVAWQPFSALRFVTSYAFIMIDDQPTATTITAFGDNETQTPQHTWILRALSNPRERLDHWIVPSGLDAAVWYVSGVPGVVDVYGTPVGDYWRLDLRGAWQATDWLAIELVGQNLTNTYHVEYGDAIADPSTYVPRSYYGKVTFTF